MTKQDYVNRFNALHFYINNKQQVPELAKGKEEKKEPAKTKSVRKKGEVPLAPLNGEEVEKPKRKRRTKAEIEADALAAAKAKIKEAKKKEKAKEKAKMAKLV